MATKARFTVTGPDLDVTSEGAAIGLSRAITAGNVAARSHREATYYVRNPSGDVVGRVVSDGSGSVEVEGEKFFRAGGRAQDAPAALQQAGRPAVGHHDSTTHINGEENDMEGSTSTEAKPDPKGSTHTRGPKKEVGGAASTKAAPKAETKPKAAPKPKADKPKAAPKAASSASDGKSKKVPAKVATVAVLKAEGGPLHVDELVKRVIATKGVKLGGKTPGATIAAMLAVENKKADGLFTRTDKATYGLRNP